MAVLHILEFYNWKARNERVEFQERIMASRQIGFYLEQLRS